MTKSFAFSVTRVVVCSTVVLALIGTTFAVRLLQRERPPVAGAGGSDAGPRTDFRKPFTAATPSQKPPTVMTFTVDTTIDLVAADPNACQNSVAGQCSLRQAVLEANARAGEDTIVLPDGTYQLTLADGGTDPHDATQGPLSITDTVNIVGDVDGGGHPASIIQACDATPSATATVCPSAIGIANKVFSINPNHDKAFATHLTNLEVRFGMNLGSFAADGSGGGIEWDGSSSLGPAAGTLTLTNCNIHDNVVTDGYGGGLALHNSSSASGTLVTITDSTISNNAAHRLSPDAGQGGGIFLGADTSMIMSNSKVLNNSALDANSSGAGIAMQAPTAGKPAPGNQIHGGTISGNQATLDGGGIFTSANLSVDQGTIISNNTAGRNGGGLWSNIANLPAAQQVMLSKVTVTGNTATGDGGGIHVDSGDASSGNNLTVNFSRLANNSGATGGNLGNAAGAVTATNNWWGSNSPAGGIEDATSAVTFDPFIVLTPSANPNPGGVNRPATLKADFSLDNHGDGSALSGNLDALSGAPVTFNNPVSGTIADVQPASLNASGQAVATFNAGPTAGAASADITVDQQMLTAPMTLVVASPPTISKLFLPDTVTVNGTVLLSFVIMNPNSDPNPNVTLTGLQFTDSLPSGVVVASPSSVSNSCGGTLTADAGSSSISLSGGSLGPAVELRPTMKGFVRRDPVASGSCFISVEVEATSTGLKTNTSGPVSANESGPGAPSNTASLNVIATPLVVPPTAAKAFGDTFIQVGGSTTVTFNVANPNPSVILNNVTLNDPLPAGLVVATPNGVTSSCAGDISAIAGTDTILLTGLTLSGNASCSFSVNVTATSGGNKINNTSPVTATFDDGTGNFHLITGGSASASILVALPPSISKEFSPATIAPTGVSTLSFLITNPAGNPVPQMGVAFSDVLPANVVVATPNGATGNCGGGTLTAASGSGSISLAGGTIPVGGFCVVSVNVTSAVTGVYTNTSGPVSSTNGGAGNTASAVLTVNRASLMISKTHAEEFHRRAIGATYTITVSDSPSAGPTIGTVSVIDILPDVTHTLVPTDISGPGWTCDLGSLTCTRSDALAPGGSYPPITLTVNVPQNITANVTNTAIVSGGGDLSSHTAYDPTHIGPPVMD